MRKFLTIFILLVSAPAVFIILRAFATGEATPVQAAAIAPITTEYHTPTFVPTQTPIPTPTIGYEATIYVAQATADEARRVNAEATAQHEANILSILQITAEAEQRSQEILSWTAQAGPTIIPLTATAQMIYDTQIANGQSIQAGALTAEYQKPTQIAAMARSYATVQFAQVMQISDIAGKFALVVFLVGIGAFCFRWRVPEKPVIEPNPTETVIQIRRDNGQGSFTQTRAVVPCSPEQLTELAEMAVNGEKRFGINRLETSSRTFKGQRQTLIDVREFLVVNKLAIRADDGLVTLNDYGETFLTAWFDAHKLPTEYEFAPAEEMEPEPA